MTVIPKEVMSAKELSMRGKGWGKEGAKCTRIVNRACHEGREVTVSEVIPKDVTGGR